jgi:hypothetical protein
MSLTEKWERFKAEQKDPTLVVTNDMPAPMHTVQIAVKDNQPGLLIVKRIYELNQAVEAIAAQMIADKTAYSVRHHLMQARLAEARHILKLLGQDNADQNT